MPVDPYTLEQCESDIALLRGQYALLTEILTQQDFTPAGSVPNTPAVSGYSMFSSSGQQKYVGFDGGTYNTGWARARTTTDQIVTSNTDGVITGTVALSLPVAAIEYRVRGVIFVTQGAGSVTQAVGFTGPATSHVRIGSAWFSNGGGAYTTGAAILSTLGGGQTTPAFTNTTSSFWIFDGVGVFTAGGTLSAVTHANGVNTFTVNSYSFLEISPDT